MNLLDKILYKNLNEKYFGFSAQGRGVLNRAKNYNNEWLPHLNNSKRMIADWLSNHSDSDILSILGSGSLIDLPEALFTNPKREIILTDANINCLNSIYPKQKEWTCSVTPVFQDVSLILQTWLEYLLTITNKSLEEYLELLTNLPKNIPAPLNSFLKADLTLSLNLTSQIPIHWNFAVNRAIEIKYGKSKTKRYEDKINEALIPCSQSLIEAHLNSLIPEKKKSSALIITDLKYYFPSNQLQEIKIKSLRSLIPEIEFQTNSQSSPLKILEQDALYDFNLNYWLAKLPKSIGYKVLDSWIWNLVPKNTRNEEQEFHVVTAIELFRP